MFDKSARKDGTFSRDDLTYDHERDVYVCPGGKKLTTTGTLVNDDATMLYRASKHDCTGCALKPGRCPNSPTRKVPRSIHEGARDMALIPPRSNRTEPPETSQADTDTELEAGLGPDQAADLIRLQSRGEIHFDLLKNFFNKIGHVWTAPDWQELFDVAAGVFGRVRSCVRPVGAAHGAAGHNAFRGSGPNRSHAFSDAMTQTGSPDPSNDLVCIASFCPHQFVFSADLAAGIDSTPPAAASARCISPRSPSWPTRSGRFCWPARHPRP